MRLFSRQPFLNSSGKEEYADVIKPENDTCCCGDAVTPTKAPGGPGFPIIRPGPGYKPPGGMDLPKLVENDGSMTHSFGIYVWGFYQVSWVEFH